MAFEFDDGDKNDDNAFGFGKPYPSHKVVADFHHNSDKDLRPESLHHTLGRSRNQAAYGDHTHNGQDSSSLLDDVFVGSRTNNVASILNQILNALEKLGATNSTSA